MKNIFKKELFRVFSDKKMIFSLFILPAVVMVGVYGLMGVMVKSMVSDVESHVAKVYVQNSPEGLKELIAQSGYLETAEITYLSAESSQEELEGIKSDILSGDVEMLVQFEADFLTKAQNYTNAGDPIPQVTLYYNSTRNYSSAARGNFNSLILAPLQTAMLQNRFGNLDLLTVFNTQEELIINEEKANGEFLAMLLPYLITFMLFASAMGLCVDAIAGEKERGTMASMLLSPVKRSSIVFGKLFALSLLSSLSSIVYASSMILAMPMMMGGLEEEAGLPMNISMSPVQMLELLALMVSLVLIYVALLCLVSVFAKNAKEANAYVMPLYMIVLVLGMMTMFKSGMETSQTMYAIPVYGTALSIQGIVTGEITLFQFGSSVLGNLICTVIAVVAVAKVFNNEKIMLNA
ncbi:MAG: ABC transporter permease [Lachnospiraceae bacterium]|nr:ABC transporter permease [Lachnospiraceae bacterium]